MRCLVTGGAGFIGSHVADSLIGSRHQVTALDNVSTGSRDNVAHLLDDPAFSLVEGSIMDAALVERLAADHDVVIHLAAAVGVKLIVERPLESLLTNIRGTENVLEAAARYGRRTLLTSTSEIYGKNARGPVSEDADRILGSPSSRAGRTAPRRPSTRSSRTPTGRTVASRRSSFGSSTASARARPATSAWSCPRFVRQALRGDPLTVHGDGQQQRSFCHVHDTVAALLTLIDTPAAAGDVFNVGAPTRSRWSSWPRRSIARTDSTLRDPSSSPTTRPTARASRTWSAASPTSHASAADRLVPHPLARRHPQRRDRARAPESGSLGVARWRSPGDEGARYVGAFLITFGAAWALTPLAGRFAHRHGFLDQPGGHSTHSAATPTLGGLADRPRVRRGRRLGRRRRRAARHRAGGGHDARGRRRVRRPPVGVARGSGSGSRRPPPSPCGWSASAQGCWATRGSTCR